MAALVAMATVLLSLSGASSLEFQHHNQSEIELFLADVVDKYPDLTRMYSIGQSIRGRTRYMYNLSHVIRKPVFFISDQVTEVRHKKMARCLKFRI